MKTMSTTHLPEKCWIYAKHRYSLYGINSPKLPYVSLEYENILKANGIPYRKTSRSLNSIFYTESTEVCEYWNCEAGFKEELLTLPLFAKVGYSYRYCEKNYSENVPTLDTIEAAKETQKFVEEEIENYKQILHEVRLYRLAKICLAGSIAQMNYKLGPHINSIEDIDMNHDRFKILSLRGTDWVAIFDMNKIVKNGYVTLQVPKHITGLVIGKGGLNIQSWAKELKVKKINVIPVEE